MTTTYKTNEDLPQSIRVLPDAAQTVWRRVFNDSVEDKGEEPSTWIAWNAVKNGWGKNSDGEWTKKAKGSADSVEIFETITLDATDVRRTTEGYLVAMPRVARSGIQVYKGWEVGRSELDEVRVYRPENQVFSTKSLKSYTHRPVTNDHPPEPVTADNWKKYAVGQTGDEYLRDGQFVRVPMVLMDSEAIADYEAGKRQLSLGYGMTLDWTAGKTAAGEAYDCSQEEIHANHLAMCRTARGGPHLRIGDQSPADWKIILDAYAHGLHLGSQQRKDETMTTSNDALTKVIIGDQQVLMSDMASTTVLRHIRGLEEQLTTLRTKMDKDLDDEKKRGKTQKDAADAEVATLKAEVETLKKKVADSVPSPQQLDAMVGERTTAIGLARKIIGDKLVSDGKSLPDIRRQVVNVKMGDVAKDWKDEQVKVSFDTITAGIDLDDDTSGDHQVDPLQDSLSGRPAGGGFQRAAKAYDGMVNDISNAWRTKPGPAAASK